MNYVLYKNPECLKGLTLTFKKDTEAYYIFIQYSKQQQAEVVSASTLLDVKYEALKALRKRIRADYYLPYQQYLYCDELDSTVLNFYPKKDKDELNF